MNAIQEQVFKSLHNRNLILKARQLGMSTFAIIFLLDQAIFCPHTSAGIVSYSLEHAQYIFKRIIGHALDTLPQWLLPLVEIVQRSAREITFGNGSTLRVDTSLRGGAYQIVLVSEFGKTCARNPVKAEEVVTGTLQAVSDTGTIIIESTGEGNCGYYADMVNQSSLRGNDDLSSQEYKLFFFPWYLEKAYVQKKKQDYEVELTDYFDKLEKDYSITLEQSQRNWYAIQRTILGDKLKQEFPSTITEAFITSSDAYYFQAGIEQAYQDSRCLSISPYDAVEPVYIAMDIGVNDLTVIVFFQVTHGEIRIIDYYANNNQGVDFYCEVLQQQKKYLYHTIFLPHDAKRRDGIVVENSYEKEFRKLFSSTSTRIIVLKQTDKNINISNAKIKMSRCVFNLTKTKPLIDYLVKYRKKWSEQFGKYLDIPLHDVSSNYADSFIYAMQAVSHIEAFTGTKGAIEKHKQIVDNRRFRL